MAYHDVAICVLHHAQGRNCVFVTIDVAMLRIRLLHLFVLKVLELREESECRAPFCEARCDNFDEVFSVQTILLSVRIWHLALTQFRML